MNTLAQPQNPMSDSTTLGASFLAPYSLLSASDAAALNHLVALPRALALQQVLLVVQQLARSLATAARQDRVAAAPAAQGGEPQIIRHYEDRGGAWWLGFFRWPPGAATPIHDHTSWGVYACAAGTLLEGRYRRLDDGAQTDRASLRLHWERRLDPGTASAFQPYAGGIHRVANRGTATAWSVHLYGPRLGLLGGRDYDPSRDHVCDRWE